MQSQDIYLMAYTLRVLQDSRQWFLRGLKSFNDEIIVLKKQLYHEDES